MTPTEQWTKIAEACGFTDCKIDELESVDFDSRSVSVWKIFRGTKNGKRERVPDYLNDLNAMHEAEQILNQDELYNYGDLLASNVRREENIRFGHPESQAFPFNGFGHAALARTSARDRALAFLKVKRGI